MHYYQFNIGDYRAATAHLSNDEDLAYRRLLDMYYDTEQKIPLDTQWVARRLRLDPKTIEAVLRDMFDEHEDGWFHVRCQEVIEHYHAMAEKNRANGKLGGRRKNPVGNPAVSDSEPIAKATNNYKPITNNQDKKQQRGSRLSQDFCLPNEWNSWARSERPELNVLQTFDKFKDYWIAQAGQKGVKLDWFATWRNWVRNTNAPKINPADIARVTVAPSKLPDPALEKIKADEKITRPPSLFELERMAQLRRKV